MARRKSPHKAFNAAKKADDSHRESESVTLMPSNTILAEACRSVDAFRAFADFRLDNENSLYRWAEVGERLRELVSDEHKREFQERAKKATEGQNVEKEILQFLISICEGKLGRNEIEQWLKHLRENNLQHKMRRLIKQLVIDRADDDFSLSILRGKHAYRAYAGKHASTGVYEPINQDGELATVVADDTALSDDGEPDVGAADENRDLTTLSSDELRGQGYALVSELSEFRTEFKHASKVTRLLDEKVANEPYPNGIRNIKKGRRRWVHASDWHNHFRDKDKMLSESLDLAEELRGGIESRKAVEREARAPRK